MYEEIEYAEMLEIPVSTVNVVKKNTRRKKHRSATPISASETAFLSSLPQNTTAKELENTPSQDQASLPLKDSVIAQLNDRMREEPAPEIVADAELFAESANSEGSIDFEPIPERIDTVRLYSSATPKKRRKKNFDLYAQEYALEEDYSENEGGRYALNNENTPSKAVRIALGVEFALSCALCGAIFLTNVFMPNSAINTFFRSLTDTPASQTDTRSYMDFELSNVVSELSQTQINISPTGIVSFTDECCVYPTADGKVSEVVKEQDGTYRMKITHSNTFTGIIEGLDHVYYAVGDEVKSNVPVGYSEGESEVQVTMYSNGELLNCFQLTEENCLAWVSQN